MPFDVDPGHGLTGEERVHLSLNLKSDNLTRARPGLVDILAITDPHERVIAELQRLEAIVEACRDRTRMVSGRIVSDPDSNGMVKAEELAFRLIASESERRGTDRPGSANQTRAEAIAELEATLEVWRDPNITDEQWAASRWKPEPPKAGGGATKRPRNVTKV